MARAGITRWFLVCAALALDGVRAQAAPLPFQCVDLQLTALFDGPPAAQDDKSGCASSLTARVEGAEVDLAQNVYVEASASLPSANSVVLTVDAGFESGSVGNQNLRSFAYAIFEFLWPTDLPEGTPVLLRVDYERSGWLFEGAGVSFHGPGLGGGSPPLESGESVWDLTAIQYYGPTPGALYRIEVGLDGSGSAPVNSSRLEMSLEVVPEPSSSALVALGLAMLALSRRRSSAAPFRSHQRGSPRRMKTAPSPSSPAA